MKTRSIILLVILGLLVCSMPTIAQTFDLQLVTVLNNAVNYDVKVQIKSNTTTFGLGSSNLVVDFTGGISNPTLLTAHNFTGGLYDALTVTSPTVNKMSVNIGYNGSSGSGTTVATSYVDVATVRFTTTDPAGSATLTWRTIPANRTNVYKDDQTNEVPAGTLNPITVNPLPVQLASFTAVSHNNGHVLLHWMTISEINNYGFEVQKSLVQQSGFQTIPNSFVPGHGTTNEPRNYNWVDNTASAGNWFYRLKQIDLDGSINYTEPVRVTVLTSVKGQPVPATFTLEQNYPNPFNPTTRIKYTLPNESRVTLEVFNLVGQKVVTLVDGVKEAGFYDQQFDGSQVSSGVYIYRLAAGGVTFHRKLMLTK